MSVICHNFVQNAWKKDLCSNCFKSVGDHEGEEVSNGNSPSSLPNGSSRQVSHSTGMYSSNSNGTTPHTTWKSLISERNQKNSQPFKLENGFQGRLLTINKASHPGEKKVGEVNIQQNGHSETSNRTTFAQSKTVNTSTSNGLYSHTNGETQNGIQNDVNNKIKFNGVKSMLNEIESKNGKLHNTVNKKNGTEQTARTSISDQKKNSQKLIKSDSEERSQSPPQSILKKTENKSPKTNNSQPRRSSNVGFKDEEPLVIGYGGRDFTPEELAWDMNCSDGENETGCDSLDETEDDKTFSKITKQNTEFNSDNSNLLIQQKQNGSCEYEKSKSAHDERVNTSNEKENSKLSLSKTQQSESNLKEENGSFRTNAVQLNLDRDDSIERENPPSSEKGGQINKSNEENGPMKVEVKNLETRNEKNDLMKDKESINVAIKNGERDQAVTSGEIVVVEGAKKASVSSEDKNSTELGNETTPPPPSPVVGAKNVEGDSGSETSDHSEMFSDGNEISKENSETEAEKNGDWQEDEVAGQILQAINTSLTNRHKMNNETNVENENFSESGKDLDDDCKKPVDLKPTSSESVTVSVCDTSVEKSESEQVSESVLNVEPRPSFLHGRVSNCKAIYGPASDLFVSRSNSSSSSSSDECNKNEMPHSITVTVNGQNARKPVVRSASAELLNVAVHPKHTLTDYETDSSVSSKYKPRIPAKPSKRPSCTQSVQIDSGHYAKPISDVKPLKSDRPKSESNINQNGTYYVVTDSSDIGGPKSITLVDHYAESNIYHEVILDTEESKLQDIDENDKQLPKRESKLAALAMELEQVRHSNNNTKRQAPAPPKIPDPPLEDPPNSSGRISPPESDSPHGFSSFRGEAMAFSSSSSTASTSSQDTETGYASWNIHGDLEEKRKHSHSKSKSSFLLAQYSKCKMLAMGYADDSAKSRKKFSIKKLLKIRKDSTENNSAFDSNYPNPKAWKYSDHFERPRARLEIIHPMDLENKSVTVNPGFDSLHSGSLSSFTASADDLSLRNSMSSDYGSFYSDTVSPFQDMKTESNYECIPNSRLQDTEEQEESDEKIATCNSNSPTPSRSSNASQASTLTSESSKNGSAASIRPPKPPPPPRAHSLLPRNKPQNADGTFKFPVEKNSLNEDETCSTAPSKPQAPKRQGKSAAPRPDCGIYDNTSSVPISSEKPQSSTDHISNEDSEEIEESGGVVLDIKSDFSQNSQKDNLEPSVECSSPVIEETISETQVNILSAKADTQKINVTVKNTPPDTEKNLKNAITRNKHPPVTKAPSRPPPIYMKPQLTIVAKKPNPWKTLEDSYLVLTTSNRELLVKLVNQAAKKRKVCTTKLQKIDFKWADFEIDLEQPSSIFAFGEKIAYHATMPQYPEYLITLVVTVQQAHNRLSESNELKYPVFGQFVDSIPHELLDSSGDGELESMQATILVLDRSNITTIECFTESLPSSLTNEHEKELSFIILQLIHSLKSLQAQGIESIDSSFQNLILAKTKMDKYNTLIFLSDNCYDENDYMSESCRISLCQYALILLFQLLGIQSLEEFDPLSETKFSSEVARKTFEIAIELLSEEKAVSLSQTKTLMECFLWELTRVREILEESDDTDSVLQRWMDVKRSNFIKNVINDENLCDINVQSEYYSQFLIRTSIRNVKEILSYF